MQLSLIAGLALALLGSPLHQVIGVQALTLTGNIIPNAHLPILFPNPDPALNAIFPEGGKAKSSGAVIGEVDERKRDGLENDVKVVLDGGKMGESWVRKADGGWEIPDIPPGNYILQVWSRRFAFPSYLIHIPDSDPPAAQPLVALHNWGQQAILPPHPAQRLNYPLQIVSLSPLLYEIPQPKFSVWNLIKGNPMIWMGILGAGMVWGMPKLMANMDPEALKEMQENQASMKKNMDSVQSMDWTSGISSFLAGPDGGPASSSPPEEQQVRQRGGGKRRR